MKVHVPPIKSQGIKTKLIPWISSTVPRKFEGVWIEPFMGTGAVAFNLAPDVAVLYDTNPHLIKFYQSIADGEVTPAVVRDFLGREGARLLDQGEGHYYHIRDRFNEDHRPLDFLFLNRAGFNGMIRFNRKGEYNVPFCRKPQRFVQAYITKIVNQVSYVARLLKVKDFTFKCQGFEETIGTGNANDVIYCDPPYVERHVDYYNGWDGEREKALYLALSKTPSKFILSTWHHNDFRENKYLKSLWNRFNVLTREHFYHLGGNEKNRHPMIEAIVTNQDLVTCEYQEPSKQEQLVLLEDQAAA